MGLGRGLGRDGAGEGPWRTSSWVARFQSDLSGTRVVMGGGLGCRAHRGPGRCRSRGHRRQSCAWRRRWPWRRHAPRRLRPGLGPPPCRCTRPLPAMPESEPGRTRRRKGRSGRASSQGLLDSRGPSVSEPVTSRMAAGVLSTRPRSGSEPQCNTVAGVASGQCGECGLPGECVPFAPPPPRLDLTYPLPAAMKPLVPCLRSLDLAHVAVPASLALQAPSLTLACSRLPDASRSHPARAGEEWDTPVWKVLLSATL